MCKFHSKHYDKFAISFVFKKIPRNSKIADNHIVVNYSCKEYERESFSSTIDSEKKSHSHIACLEQRLNRDSIEVRSE